MTIDLEPSKSGIPGGGPPLKKDSFKEAQFWDAKSTNLPVYGKRLTEDDIIEGPMEAEPQVMTHCMLCCAVQCCAVLGCKEYQFVCVWQ